MSSEQSTSTERYTVHKIDNRQWGGVQWAIWDNEIQAWADSLGRYLTESVAQRAANQETRS